MPLNDPRSRFELVAVELRSLGLTLRSLPGEYSVNFRYGGEGTARFADDLDQALELGRAMAADRAVAADTAEKPARRRWRRRKMTPKARRRRFILGHNRRLRAQALPKRRGKLRVSPRRCTVRRWTRRRR